MATVPFKVKAIYAYSSEHSDDLSFPIGQVITVTEEEDDEWYIGSYTDGTGSEQSGLFPRNFVEKYEPQAPPRPTRSRPPAATAAATEAAAPPPAITSPPISEDVPAVKSDEPAVIAKAPTSSSKPVQPAPAADEEKSVPATSKPAAKVPPPTASKPTTNSFKDRIAAFNKASAAPIAPGKPGGTSSTTGGFIRKPFVAPPPSRDAYVPAPKQEAPQKVYRREEDPEIAERQQQDQEDAERAGLTVKNEYGTTAEEDGEAPKTTSLKDRIALLQKQQQEAAARRAELVQREKPSRPATKPAGDQITPMSPTDDAKGVSRSSTDASMEAESRPSLPRHISRDARSSIDDTRHSMSDGNEADQSGAGDTTEDAADESTEVDEPGDKPEPHLAPHPPTVTRDPAEREQMGESEADEDEEEEEETEEQAEARRKEELRARMAKMSGGMGMAGMFGAPGGMSMPAPRKKPTASDSATSPPAPTQRIPMIPVPGMGSAPPIPGRAEVSKEVEPIVPSVTEGSPDEVPDVEDLPQARRSEGRAFRFSFDRPVSTNRDSRSTSRSDVVTTRFSPADFDGQRDDAEMVVMVAWVSKRSAPPPVPSHARPPPPPAPSSRPVPPPPEARMPPPPPTPQHSNAPASPGSESEDEEETTQSRKRTSTVIPAADSQGRAVPPPIPSGAPPPPQRTNTSKRVSTLPTSPPPVPISPPTTTAEKRSSRVPPVPIASPQMPPHGGDVRAPPPPPPPSSAPPSRTSTLPVERREDFDDEQGESDYEGDYDTDIASSATHKDALKAVPRDSIDETTLSEDAAVSSPSQPRGVPPPLPPGPRGMPPPPPSAGAPRASRGSTEAERPMPPLPPPRNAPKIIDDDDYDPYKYGSVPPSLSRAPSEQVIQPSEPALYEEPRSAGGSAQVHAVPPPLPLQHQTLPITPGDDQRLSRDYSRKSTEVPRASMGGPRRSMDQVRPSMEQGSIARDLDLAEDSTWWSSENTPPPSLQGRNDILCEYEENSTSKRGGRTTITRDVYVLFHDYSQTIISARFDSKNVSDVSFEQRHEPAPAKLRQDQLEEAYGRYGPAVAKAAGAALNQTVGDGTAQSLVYTLLTQQNNALLPVGTRAFGALVYGNLANASVQQLDEIRPGDIVSFRNAKFSGKHGAMHAKYSEDVGKPDHVAIVAEWDGTKKKVRAWEQGRDTAEKGKAGKVKLESFKLGDLRSGEVKVWRVMGREWVGWE